jgi:shikimate kinase/3-dehydroquinate synthase
VTPARVLLVGMMGAGKTSVGTALSRRTGWPYLDNDTLVARAAGIATPGVLRSRGEAALPAAESGARGLALETPPPVIASIAAGVVVDPEDRARLAAGGFVVWLRAEVATLARRVGSGEGRPWLQPSPEVALRRLYEGRAPLYAEVASLVVDVDEATPDRTAELIAAALARSGT